MERGPHDLTLTLPRQINHPEVPHTGQAPEHTDPDRRLMLCERRLRLVTGTSTSEHPATPRVRAESTPQLEVARPHVELVTGSGSSSAQAQALGVVGGTLRGGGLPSEPFVHGVPDDLVEQDRADARPGGAPSPRAAVAHVALGVDGAREHVPAAGAARHPGDEAVPVLRIVVPHAHHPVRSRPQLVVHEGGPRVLDAQSARTDEHALSCFAADDAVHGARMPERTVARRGCLRLVECAGDLTPAHPACAQFEDALAERARFRVHDGAALGVAGVPVRGAAGESALRHGARLRRCEMFDRLVAEPLGHDEQQAEHGASHGGCGVHVFRDADDARPAPVEFVDGGEPARRGACEPVESCDDDPFGSAVADPFERGVHPWPVHGAAGPVEVFVPLGDADAVRGCPSLDSVALFGGGLEAFPGASADDGHSDVAVHDGLVATHAGNRSRVRFVPTSRARAPYRGAA